MKTDWKDMLASLYGFGVDSKNFLYDTGLIDAAHLPVPVLSVGNLSVGGTGKTPVVQALLKMAQERGLRVMVVSRNYAARSLGIQRIDLGRADGAAFYGDEAFMLASKFPTVPIWTGPRKYLTAQTAVRGQSPDLVIVDDGFQHRSLQRDFDLVLLDCTALPEEEMILPQGRFREGFASLQRAHMVILTKVNWASEERVNMLRSRVPAGVPVYEMEFRSRPSREIAADTRVLALSGIAKPQVFEKSLEALQAELGISFKIASHLSFPDHFDYQKSDVEKILQKFRDLGVSEILTTEKDFVKLQVFPEIKELLNPLQIFTQFRQDPSELYGFLDRSRRH